MIRLFLCYMNFYIVSFSSTYSAGAIWSSICIQDIVKPELHYQINLIRLINIITRFLYQVCLIDKSDDLEHRRVSRTQSNI